VPAAFGASLGGGSAGSAEGLTVTLTTAAAVPAGGHVVLSVKWYNAVTISSVAGTGVTSWTLDEQKNSGSDANFRIGLVSIKTSAGIASGTVITVTFSGNAFARGVIGAYWTGLAEDAWEDVAAAGSNGNANPWSAGSVAPTVGESVVIGCSWVDFTNSTSSPLDSFSEAVDFYDSLNNNTHTLVYRIVTGSGPFTASGTWAITGQPWVATAVVYKLSTGAAAIADHDYSRFPRYKLRR
jgi:hypothetical protein